jgi:hypothetical protein
VCEYGDYDLSSLPGRHRSSRPIYDKGGSSRPDTRRGVPVKPDIHLPEKRRKRPSRTVPAPAT